ncbi:DUF1534 domain-containing protein [Pseudomonas congelans]|nr:DUF1534 domain-containing protein [Pseudomonas congelans]QVX13739.1 DUF1534 domain-containing protein [Pseudomonas congelans]
MRAFCWALFSGSHTQAFLTCCTVRIGRRASRTACPRGAWARW